MHVDGLNANSSVCEGAVSLLIDQAEIDQNGPTFATLKVKGKNGKVSSARVAVKVTTQGVRFQLVAKKDPNKGQLQPHCIREATGDWL